MKTSVSDREDYRRICRLACKYDSFFKMFKGHEYYRRILEHVSEEQGQAYLDIIREEGEDLLEYFPKFRENDKYGGPITFTYDVGEFSPTTLRYIKVLMDLKNIFGDLNNLNIIEIGGGYGGQCKIISDVFSYQSYVIVDLDVVLALTQKYLTKLNVKNVKCLDPNDLSDDKMYDLVISNYAFSECIRSVQDDYIDKILNRSRRGYITYNYDIGSKVIYHPASTSPYNKEEITQILSKNYHVHIIDERPNFNSVNFSIIWDDIHQYQGYQTILTK